MKEVDNLHFITPTGCTFYGKQRWSKSRSILFLVLSWILTPIIAVLLIALAIPLLFIVLPIMMARKSYKHSVATRMHPARRVLLCTSVFLIMFILTPFILALGIIVGIPLLLFFIYFYMPRRYLAANF